MTKTITTFRTEDGKALLADTKWDEIVDAKGLSFEEKADLLRFLLSDETLCNVGLLVNVALLVKGSTLDESEFAAPQSMFTSLEEYIDLKQEVQSEVKAYRNELAKWFLAAFKSMSVVLPDGKIDIPASYHLTLSSFDVGAMAKVLHSASVDFNSLPMVNDAEAVVLQVMGISPFVKQICSVLKIGEEK